MRKTIQNIGLITTILFTSLLTACDTTTKSLTIPTVNNEITIANAAETLGITEDVFISYLDNIELTFDEYIDGLNSNNTTLKSIKTDIEDKYNCTFDEYVKTTLLVNNKTLPSEKTYYMFESEFSLFDAYIPITGLNEDRNYLTEYGIQIAIADTANDVYAFDVMQNCNGDFGTYIDILCKNYKCVSIEFTNVMMFGGYGSIKPDEENACLDNLFVYDTENNEILEELIVPIMTLHFEDNTKNMSFGLSNELGLFFKTTGTDSKAKMLKLNELEFQIRKAS